MPDGTPVEQLGIATCVTVTPDFWCGCLWPISDGNVDGVCVCVVVSIHVRVSQRKLIAN